MNGYRESDSPIVSEKPSNKTGDNKSVAEKVEKRRPAKGNSVERNKDRALNRRTLQSEPTRIRQGVFINNLSSLLLSLPLEQAKSGLDPLIFYSLAGSRSLAHSGKGSTFAS